MKHKSITLLFLFIATLTFTLGIWQLYRLNWKNNLIGNISSSIENPKYFNEQVKYEELTSVLLDKTFSVVNDPIFIESKTFKNKIGYHALLPLKLDGRVFSVLNLGWVQDKENNNISSLINSFHGIDEVRTYIRNFNSQKPPFVPKNDLDGNIWFSVNKNDLQSFFNETFSSKYYFVLLDPLIKFDVNPSAYLRNNHLNYAITWFLLSLSSIVILMIIRKKNG